MVEGGRKEVDGDQPSAEQIPANLLAEGPFGAQNLQAPTERIREDVEAARNKLGEQTNVCLAQAKNGLSHLVEAGGTGTTLLVQVRQGGGIVGEQSH